MRIAFDAKRLFFNQTGLGNYSRSLVTGLSQISPNDELILCSPKEVGGENKFAKSYKTIFPKGRFQKFAWRSFGIIKDLQAHKIELYHGLSHEIPLGIQKSGIKSVVTIHDLIYKFYPNDFSFIDRIIYDFKWKNSCKNADAIIATSEATKKDIISYFSIPESKIHVVYQSCDSIFDTMLSHEERASVLQKFQLPSSYLLYVGALMHRKNVLELVQAYQALGNKVSIPLVIVGRGKKYKTLLQSFIVTHKLEKKVLLLDNVNTEDLPALYQSAHTFIYPSKYEGFGIPVIEALKSGTQVITSNCSCLPEVGGHAAIYCDPFSVSSISKSIQLAIEEPIPLNRIQQHANNFSTELFVKKTIDVYKSVM